MALGTCLDLSMKTHLGDCHSPYQRTPPPAQEEKGTMHSRKRARAMSRGPQPSSRVAPPGTREDRVRSVPVMRESEAGSTLPPCTSRRDDTYMIRMCESRFCQDNKNYDGQEDRELSRRGGTEGKESEFIFVSRPATRTTCRPPPHAPSGASSRLSLAAHCPVSFLPEI